MNSSFDNPRFRPDELNRLHDAARERALQLRREAIDDFWRAADGLLADAVINSHRIADRLAASMRRHAQRRDRAAAASPSGAAMERELKYSTPEA
jgi:hypothetical protein